MSQTPRNKTVTVWLALLGGSLGLHRFYLRGLGDTLGWLHPIAAAIGWWGVERAKALGQDDQLAWLLVPFLGASVAVACLAGIVYALAERSKWNRWFNPGLEPEAEPGATHGITIVALVLSLLLGATAFMASLTYGIQHYYEYQIEESIKLTQ
jgi:TM2 domain-containing membrane protein YozV